MLRYGPSLRRALLAFLLLALSALLFAQGGAATRPWYAERLEKLGFTVFPKPVDVGDFAAQTVAGGSVKLSELRGKIVLLNFWATWCPPCRAEMPAIEALWNKTKAANFTVMGISVGEEPGTVKSYIAQNGYTYPVFVDPQGALGAAFDTRAIPTTYIIDKSGKAIAGIRGGAAYDSSEATALFAELAAK